MHLKAMWIFKKARGGDNYFFKKTKPLANEQLNSYQNAKTSYICKKTFEEKHAKDITYRKVEDHCHYTGKNRGALHSICNLK